jgi:hypothetical protein
MVTINAHTASASLMSVVLVRLRSLERKEKDTIENSYRYRIMWIDRFRDVPFPFEEEVACSGC